MKKAMDNNKLIELFYEHTQTMHNLWKFKQQLRHRWEDVEQDTLINLIRYNENHEVNEKDIRGLIFLMLKQQAITELNNGESKFKTIGMANTISLDDADNSIEAISDDNDTEDTSTIVYYREKLLELITMEEYILLVEHFSNRNKKTPEEVERLNKIKRKLGYKSYYQITVDDTVYIARSIRSFCKEHNFNLDSLYATYEDRGSSFTYLGQKITIRKKTKFTKMPGVS